MTIVIAEMDATVSKVRPPKREKERERDRGRGIGGKREREEERQREKQRERKLPLREGSFKKKQALGESYLDSSPSPGYPKLS